MRKWLNKVKTFFSPPYEVLRGQTKRHVSFSSKPEFYFKILTTISSVTLNLIRAIFWVLNILKMELLAFIVSKQVI